MSRWAWPLAIFVAMMATSLLCLPLTPEVQTRYVAVAFEMWHKGDFLLPTLNGVAYAHKPPLMFWAMHLGWLVFGVGELWARLLSPLASLGTLFLTWQLARRLWPVGRVSPWLAVLALVGTPLFVAYSSVVMMDAMLTCWTALGLLGIVEAGRAGRPRGWPIYGLAVGLGLLTKGPVIFVYLLPPLLTAPLWATEGPRRWPRFYAGGVAAVLCGAAMVLAWAVPAARSGGPAYSHALFVTQTAERVVGTLGHPQPWWWFLPLFPIFLLPWICWRPVWDALRRPRELAADPGLRLCGIQLVAPLVLFSFFPGKQLHYLMPLAVPLALFVARAVAMAPEDLASRGRVRVFAAITLVFAAVMLGLAAGWLPPLASRLPAYLRDWSFVSGSLIAVGAVAVAVFRPGRLPGKALQLTLLANLLVAGVLVELRLSSYAQFDVAPAARELARIEAEGREIGVVDDEYKGEFHFAGRMTEPFAVIWLREAQLSFAARNPRGVVLSFCDEPSAAAQEQPLARYPYKGGQIAIWSASAVTATAGGVLSCEPVEPASEPGTKRRRLIEKKVPL